MATTYTEKYRQEGDELYNSCKKEGLGTSVQKHRLEKAREWYNKAYRTADREQDLLIAAKQIYLTSKWLCELYSSTDIEMFTVNLVVAKRHHDNALKHANNTAGYWYQFLDRMRSAFSKPQVTDYLPEHQALLRSFIELVRDRMSMRNHQPYYHLLMKAGKAHEDVPDVAVRIYLLLITKYFNFAVVICQEYENSAKALNFINDCDHPLNELNKFVGGAERTTKVEVDEYKENLKIHKAICQGRLEIMKGDKLLAMVGADIGRAWYVADVYRQAIDYVIDPATGNQFDSETEAIAYAKLGILYDQVIKNVSMNLAKPCFQKAIQLAMELTNPAIRQADWFFTAQVTLARYQQELEMNDSAAQIERMNRLRSLMRGEMDKLNRIRDSDAVTFITQVYLLFPLKSGKAVKFTDAQIRDLSRWYSSQSSLKMLKNALKKALIHYHPDKNNKHGEEWQVLCNDISAIVSKHYQNFKDLDVISLSNLEVFDSEN